MGCSPKQQETQNNDLLICVADDTATENIYTVDEKVQFSFYEASQLEEFDGDYTGNAVGFAVQGAGYQSYGYKVKFQKNYDEYRKMKSENDFGKLYIWICVDYTGDTGVTLTNYYGEALNENTFSVKKEQHGKWFKIFCNLTLGSKEKYFDEAGNPKELTLFRTHFEETPKNGEKLHIYIGNIGLC